MRGRGREKIRVEEYRYTITRVIMTGGPRRKNISEVDTLGQVWFLKLTVVYGYWRLDLKVEVRECFQSQGRKGDR